MPTRQGVHKVSTPEEKRQDDSLGVEQFAPSAGRNNCCGPTRHRIIYPATTSTRTDPDPGTDTSNDGFEGTGAICPESAIGYEVGTITHLSVLQHVWSTTHGESIPPPANPSLRSSLRPLWGRPSTLRRSLLPARPPRRTSLFLGVVANAVTCRELRRYLR